jgi:uncharacterized protein (TIGR03086 family)
MSSGIGDGRHSMTAPDLEPAARRVAALIDGIPDSALGAPTPADIPVAGLLDHFMGLTEAFRAAARKEPDPGAPPEASAEHLDPRWRTVLPARLDALVAAWRDPAAVQGTASAGGVEMPAPDILIVALDELVLHGWDLARATGQPYEPDPADVTAILGFVESFGSPEGTPGLFGPAVPVPDDAPAFDRALGLSGRDPAWRTSAPTAG